MTAYYNEKDRFKAQWLRELIGAWSFALRLAGWRDDRPVWTGSCPCQPFSQAGKRKKTDDERHLWPHWFWLISQSRPHVVFGEQVAAIDGLGWFDLVQTDLEGTGYAVGAADLCAAGVGAPHIRQRLFFVAESDRERFELKHALLQPQRQDEAGAKASRDGETGELGDPCRSGRSGRSGKRGNDGAKLPALERAGGPVSGFWRDAEWIYCRDEKYRLVEPGSFPLAHGAPARVGRLRGYGDAIVAEVAAAFIKAYREAKGSA